MKIDAKPLIEKFQQQHSPAKIWKGWAPAIIGIAIFFTVFISILIIAGEFTLDDFSGFINDNLTFIVGIAALLFLLAFLSSSKKASEERTLIKKYEKVINEYTTVVNPILEGQNIIYLPYIFLINKNNQSISLADKHYFWKDSKNLYFIHTEPLTETQVSLELIQIPTDSIEYFELIGERFYENKISGGGSQKPNLMGAIIGEEMFGTAGAIVGGQQKIDPIKSELVLHDDRRTKLIIKNQEAGISMIILDFNMMEILNKLFPAKNKEMVDAVLKNKIINENQSNNTNIKSSFDQKLELLDKLLAEGVINEQEYSDRKNKLLDDVLR